MAKIDIFKQEKKPYQVRYGDISAWRGKKESNPHQRFWRPLFYH